MNSSIKGHKEITKIWNNYISDKVFFIPILGPIYSSEEETKKILFNVLENSKSEKFLSYDKNIRWFKEKPEKIIRSSIKVLRDGLFIATQDKFFKKINIYYYANISPDEKVLKEAWKIGKILNLKLNYNRLNFYCFKKPKFKSLFITHNIYLKIISENDRIDNGFYDIKYYDSLPKNQQKTFSEFVNEDEHHGLNFLWHEYLKQKKQLSPIICAMKDSRIIGAIGSLDVSIDASGHTFLHPPYFGVLNKYKRSGVGKKLWSTAMKYAFQEGAKYTLVQNTPDSPAALFYEKQSLKPGSQIFSCTINV